MELFISPSSPYARTVRLLVAGLSLTDRIKEKAVNVFEGENPVAPFNPLGKIPCLHLDDGQSLIDSRLICEYLDEVYGESRWHRPLSNNWPLKNAYQLSIGLCDIAVAWRVEKSKAAGDGLWLARFKVAVERSLAELENCVSLFEQDSIASLSLLSTLAYLNFRHEELAWADRFDKLNQFLIKRESMAIAQANHFSDLK